MTDEKHTAFQINRLYEEFFEQGLKYFFPFGAFTPIASMPDDKDDLSDGNPQTSVLSLTALGSRYAFQNNVPFTKSGLRPGQTLLVQGSSGGMATALIQLGRAAGFEVWTTSRNDEGHALAEKLGAHRTFTSNEKLPHKVQAVVDNIGPASWAHSIASVARGGTIVITGGTTGFDVNLPLLPVLSEQITVRGSIMGTLQDMKDMVTFIAASGITPEIGLVLPMEQAAEGFRTMWEGRTHGKTVFTR